MLLVANLFGECNTALCMVVIAKLMSYLDSCVLHCCSSIIYTVVLELTDLGDGEDVLI